VILFLRHVIIAKNPKYVKDGELGQNTYFLFAFQVAFTKQNYVRDYPRGRQGVNEVVLQEVEQVKRAVPIWR
tara:strand:+ start:508 stop:723 length:216 start_codon:yes stop_codon:yes gene_type:complete